METYFNDFPLMFLKLNVEKHQWVVINKSGFPFIECVQGINQQHILFVKWQATNCLLPKNTTGMWGKTQFRTYE